MANKKPTIEMDFTPRTIKEIEDVGKKPFLELIQDYSMGNILLFVQKGAKLDEEQADSKITKYFEEGGDFMGLYVEIMEKLKDRGFLPKAVDLSEVKKKLKT